MSYIPSCDHCDTAMPQCDDPNYVSVDGDLEMLCGDCLQEEQEDCSMCDLCERVAGTTYSIEDFLESTLPVRRSAWAWGNAQICARCVGG